MKKKDIINLIKEENSRDVELTYDFNRVAEEVGISSIINLEKRSFNQHYKMHLFFKYASLCLFFIVLLLSVVTIYQVNNPIIIEGPPISQIPTKEELVAKYFEEQNAKYIKTPVKTEILNGILVNIYIGVIDGDEVIFIYTFESLTIGSHVEILTNGLAVEGLEENKDLTNYSYGDVFASSTLKLENMYKAIINCENNEDTLNIIIDLDITQFIAYLDK